MPSDSARYLIFFQYLGTRYSGVMKAPPHQAVKGVQNYLEEAVRRLRPANAISLHVSRVTHAHRVHGAFHARFQAVSRTYVYRLAMGIRHHSCMPLTEDKLCWGIRSVDLDIGAMRDAAALLVGTHNFSSFRALNSETPYKDPVKTLDRASLEPGDAFVRRHFHRGIQFWELTFRSRSFLYKQVRRMTGALVAVGQGKMSVYGVKELLEAQDSLAYPQNLTAPPDGLFLARVDYDPLDLPPHTQDDSYS
ncbi:tRNA pseudouridine synthase-like 1 isoform X3 [Esox lucius]|uniref:tRNA pseudouridine synthase-like 1 isoform X3 n=1 Tax=Esox lucius TaxID=8010 RepID=UPI001476E087|nr:tRNA pseudouridine synthase-like 1 isoform X3 [Esox lucius]